MNDEIPYNPPGMDEYIQEGARKNSALLRKMQGKPTAHETAEAQPGSLHPAGSAALVREQDAANELYEAACCLMRYKEANQWNNLENAAHRFNAARQSRISDEIMRQNGPAKRPAETA